MKKNILSIIAIVIAVSGLAGISYYVYQQVDFIGVKSPQQMESNIQFEKNMLLKAEYINNSNCYKVNLLDSNHILIHVSNDAGEIILQKEYKISGDTISVLGNLKNVQKYQVREKYLIHHNKLLYSTDLSGAFDTSIFMTIKVNKLK